MSTKKNLALFSNRDSFLTSFDNIFDDLMKAKFPDFESMFGIDFFGKGAFPKVDVVDYSDRISIVAEVPGLSKDQLRIDVEDDTLTISGNKRSSKQEEGRYIIKELKHAGFRRSFKLNDSLDRDSINAKFEDGTLIIDINKTEPMEPERKQIDIQ